MKTIYLLAALLLVPSLATSTTTQTQTRKNGTRPQAYEITGREIVAPPWSFACMTDLGPSQCGQHMWFYGSSDALGRYRNGF